jgi:hypothetical protein
VGLIEIYMSSAKKLSTWLAWACDAPLNKFRDLEIYFSNSYTYVAQAYKFKGRWCI